MKKTGGKWPIAGLCAGAMLMLGPICGLLGTLFGMLRSYQTIISDGQPAPQEVSGGIQTAVYATAAGLLAFVVGVAVFVASLAVYIRSRKRN